MRILKAYLQYVLKFTAQRVTEVSFLEVTTSRSRSVCNVRGARTERGWTGKTRSRHVLPTKNKILKSKQFSLGTATAIFLSQTNMLTIKDARTLLLESYLDGVIDEDEFNLLYDETSPGTRNSHMNYYYCYYYYYYYCCYYYYYYYLQ